MSFSSDVKEMVLNTSFQSRKLSLNADLSIRVECEGTGDCSLVGIDSCFHSHCVVTIHLSGLQQCYSFCSEDIDLKIHNLLCSLMKEVNLVMATM